MNWSGRRVLVTGAAGFIGSNLCDALVEAGAEVLAIDDLSVGRLSHLQAARSSGRLEFHQASILQPEQLPDLSRVEVVFHLAVACLRVSLSQPEHVHEVNATGTLRLLEACRLGCARLQRFLYCSSSEVYGTAQRVPMDETHPLEPTTVYGASKLAGELYTRAYERTHGMPITVIRPFNTYGPREHHEGASGEVIPRFAVRILNGLPPLIFGAGDQKRDFTYVQDTCRGLMELTAHPETLGQTLNLARGEEVSVLEIAQKLLRLLGREQLGVSHRPARPGDVQRHFASPERARRLGVQAVVGIDEGLQRYLQWLQTQGGPVGKLLEEVSEQNW